MTKALALNVRPVVSGCFESGVGLLALAEFVWASTGDAVPAGLDTYRWLGRRRGPAAHPFQPGAIRWSDALAQDHCIDGSMLSEIRHD